MCCAFTNTTAGFDFKEDILCNDHLFFDEVFMYYIEYQVWQISYLNVN